MWGLLRPICRTKIGYPLAAEWVPRGFSDRLCLGRIDTLPARFSASGLTASRPILHYLAHRHDDAT
jgi:hypothetical protein